MWNTNSQVASQSTQSVHTNLIFMILSIFHYSLENIARRKLLIGCNRRLLNLILKRMLNDQSYKGINIRTVTPCYYRKRPFRCQLCAPNSSKSSLVQRRLRHTFVRYTFKKPKIFLLEAMS